MNETLLIEQALAFVAKHSVPVFPCEQDKAPTTANGFYDAEYDPDIIKRLFSHPDAALIAMPTGETTGISILDIDVKKVEGEPSGFDWLECNSSQLPDTHLVRTQSGGFHYYFIHPKGLRCSAGKIAPGVDVRADGGYAVVEGTGYEVFKEMSFDKLPSFPEAVLSQLKPKFPSPKKIKSGKHQLAKIWESGSWHVTVRDFVAATVSRGDSRNTIMELAPVLSLPGYTVEQTRNELADFYKSAVSKGWAPDDQKDFAPLLFPLPASDPLPTLTESCIPPSLRPWLTDITYRMDIPLEYVAAASLVAASSIIGRRAAVRPKVNDPWEEYGTLWGLIIAPPGELKSPSTAQALKPLKDLEHKARKRWEQVESELRKKRAVLTQRESAAKSILKDIIKKGIGSEADAEKELEDIHAKLVKIETKLAHGGQRFLCNDATTEKLAELCQANPYGLLVSRDEISGWFEALTRAGKEGDREFFLEAWSGDGEHSYDRIGRGTLYIPHVCLSMFGTIQPGKLDHLINSAGKDGKGADGLLQRFQILFYPDERRPRQYVDEKPNVQAQDAYKAVFEQLAAEEWKSLCSLEKGMPVAGPDESPHFFFHFDEEAQSRATDWLIALESQIASIEAHAYKSHIAKYRGLMPRLALNYFLIEASAGTITEQKIPLAAVEFAIKWCELLEVHARKLWATSINPALAPTAKMAQHILSGRIINNMETSAIQQKHWSKLKTTDQVDLAISQLETWGWVKRYTRETMGRPSSYIRLNPKIPI